MDQRVEELSRRVRGVARGTVAMIFTRIVDVGATYAFYAIIARALTVSDFGRLILGFTILQTAASVTRAGLDQALMTVPASGSVNRFIAAVIGTISIVVAAIGALVVPPFGIYLAAALPALALGQFVTWALRARGDVVLGGVAEGIVQPVSALAFAIAVSRLSPSLAGFALALLGSWLTTLVFAFRLDWNGPRLARDEARSILRTGRSMLGVSIFQQIGVSVDVLILGAVAATAEVGLYSAAQKIATVFLLLHGAITAAVTPYMRALADDSALLGHYHRVVTRWSVTAALPLLVVTTGLPALLLRLFGRDYLQGSIPLILLSIAAFAPLLSGAAGSVLLCSGHAKTLFRLTASGVIALVLGVALFAHYGAIGAAIGVLVGRSLGRGLLLGAVRRLTGGPLIDMPLVLLVITGVIAAIIAHTAAPWIGDIAAAITGSIVALAGAIVVLTRTGDVAILRAELLGS